jgi:hypothetical protein
MMNAQLSAGVTAAVVDRARRDFVDAEGHFVDAAAKFCRSHREGAAGAATSSTAIEAMLIADANRLAAWNHYSELSEKRRARVHQEAAQRASK